MDFYSEVIEQILDNNVRTKNELHNLKISLCRKYKLKKVPSDAKILESASEDIYELVEPFLRTKPMRTISGVAPVAVMTSPARCPHGTCMYCPGGIDHGSAQSYTGFEPAALRAGSNDFNPFYQAQSRLAQLDAIGHPTDKIDLIVMGGTFTARDTEYQDWFLRGCFCAMNDHAQFDDSLTLEKLHRENETAKHRCIGLTIETRPDVCKFPQVDTILSQGGTRVELGVQTVFDSILKYANRGHTTADSIESTRILKDSGLKVCFHLMPGLPGMDAKQEREAIDTIFNDQRFKPDMLKIYPTLVVKGTKLYELWKANKYQPLDTQTAVELIAYLKTHIPPWVRIQRIQRDIPVQHIECGIQKSNLRQLVNHELDQAGQKCNCIRCREVGHLSLKGIEPNPDKIGLRKIEYTASDGTELFMSYEDLQNDILIAFVRLRLPSRQAHRPEFYSYTDQDMSKQDTIPNSAIIRELKVFGPMVGFDIDNKQNDKNTRESTVSEWQHRGYGQLLIEDAERYAQEKWGCKRLLIMSGVGVRNYYKRFGYEKFGAYMGKAL
jgi:elongator complex protein 3